MPLEHGAKPGSPGFGRNIGAEMNAGKPQKQAVAIAYSEARHSKDAASVRVLGGEDPAGGGELISVPRMAPTAAPVGQVQNVGLPSQASLAEPYPWNSPPIASKTVYPQPKPIQVVHGGEVSVEDELTGDVGGLSYVNGKKTGYEINTADDNSTSPIGSPPGAGWAGTPAGGSGIPTGSSTGVGKSGLGSPPGSGPIGDEDGGLGGMMGEDDPTEDAGLFGGLMGPVNSALESAQKPAPSSGSTSTPSTPAQPSEPEGGDYGGGGDTPEAK